LENNLEEYEGLTKYFINQYNQFCVEDLEGNKHYIDGEKKLNENLTGNGGLIRAYENCYIKLSLNSHN